MISLKIEFGRAASGSPRASLFALVLLALAIDDDRQARDEEMRKKRNAPLPRKRKTPCGPCPY